MCGVIARHYERDTSTLTKNLATVIEPVLIVLISLFTIIGRLFSDFLYAAVDPRIRFD